jgi:trk system potassium uptake protein TrkH
LIFREFKKLLSMEEVRNYFILILCSILLIMINIFDTTRGVFDALTQATFQVASIISSTGFSTVDFDQWNSTAKTVLVFLMLVGACAGSTGGGLKVSRLTLAIKTVHKELTSYIHPKSVKKLQMEGKPIEHDVLRSVNVYFISFIIVFGISMFLVSLEGYDLVTNFTAVAAMIGNTGPGLALVGPSHNFGFFNPFTKYVLMFDMLAGRLELFPLLILFHPDLWKQGLHFMKKHS